MTDMVYKFLRAHGKAEAAYIARSLSLQAEDCYHALVLLYDAGMVVLNAPGNHGKVRRSTWEVR